MSPQQSIAHFRVVSKLGEGGMGEVWRALDTKLNRDVAIKVLPGAFALDEERIARLTREARVLASLNHPNIAAIYGVEECALVMELVPGPTLADRIAQGPIPQEEALKIAGQICEALEYAHEHGVVHRDLKPANIKITPEGRLKILDFGLAKAISQEGVAANPISSPTLTMQATIAGMIMGTAAYMAPEQARGQNVDQRADIWAFGVVMVEMLTGKNLFTGPTISDTLAAVLKTEPDLTEVPAPLRPIVARCLRKDVRERWQSASDVRFVLEAGVAPGEIVVAKQPRRRKWAVEWLAGLMALAAVVMSVLYWRAARPEDHPLTRLTVDLGPDASFTRNLMAAISPDGRRLVFPARGPDGVQRLATRLLDQAQATLLPGTENGQNPFFKPDGQWIGFSTNSRLQKISVQGGAPVKVANISAIALGASWGDDNKIYLAPATLLPLSIAYEEGSKPQPLTKLGASEITHRWPQALPGGNAVLFTATAAGGQFDEGSIEAVSLKSGQVKILVRGGYYGRYLPTGHLVYVRQGVLYGVGFDVGSLEVRGAPVPLVADMAGDQTTGNGRFDFSATGTFVYSAGKGVVPSQAVWLGASGNPQPVLVKQTILLPRLSPDGKKLAFMGAGTDIYIHDLERDATEQLTFTHGANSPVWAPDAKHIVYQASGHGWRLNWVRTDGAGEPQLLLDSPDNLVTSWAISPDGRHLAYFRRDADTGFDIWTLPLDLTDPDHPKPGNPELFLRTPNDELVPRFSPDGRWMAYRSSDSGTNQVYVRPFPAGSAGQWQISTDGALYGLWSNNGRELFFETADNRIMVVDYHVEGNAFVHSKPRLWSDARLFYSGNLNLDLAPDGKRFLALWEPEPEKGPAQVTMLLNFFDEVKRRIPY
jgi:serine/threonine-protein kinase